MMKTNLLDESILAELNELSVEVPNLVEDMIDRLTVDLPIAISKMKDAVNARDLDTLNHLAHSLKGQTAILGAHVAAHACQELEYAANDKQNVDYSRLLTEVSIQTHQALLSLEDYLKSTVRVAA